LNLRTAGLILFAVFGAAIPVSMRWGDPVDQLLGTVRLAHPLAESVPVALAGWSGTDQPLTARERTTIGADDVLQRLYRGPQGESVTLFVSFHGNKQRGLQRYYHNPTICYRDAGWNLVDTRFERVTVQDAAEELPTCRYLFERSGARLAVTTFFRVDDQFLDESPRNKPFWTLLEKLKPALSDEPGSVVQVQVVVAIRDGDEGAAAGAVSRFLQVFGRRLLSAIEVGVGA
jgi:EpsI family protein